MSVHRRSWYIACIWSLLQHMVLYGWAPCIETSVLVIASGLRWVNNCTLYTLSSIETSHPVRAWPQSLTLQFARLLPCSTRRQGRASFGFVEMNLWLYNIYASTWSKSWNEFIFLFALNTIYLYWPATAMIIRYIFSYIFPRINKYQIVTPYCE